MLNRQSSLGCIMIVLVILAVILGGCKNEQTGQAQAAPTPSVVLTPAAFTLPAPTAKPTSTLFIPPTGQATPTSIVLGPLFEVDLDLIAGPVEVPLELQIPSLKITAPVLGVGLTSKNVMDAPKGPIDDPVWHSAFWYRGSGLPGEPGTAAIAGHINDPLGRSEIFADLEDLKPGDLIIIRYTQLDLEIRFTVDQTILYSTKESSDPAVLEQIFGTGPVNGTEPQPSLDGLSHLSLITCAGNIVDGQFDHHTVVFTTRHK